MYRTSEKPSWRMWASAAVNSTARAAGINGGGRAGRPSRVLRPLGPSGVSSVDRTPGPRGGSRLRGRAIGAGRLPDTEHGQDSEGAEPRGESPHRAEAEASVEQRAIERPAQRGGDLP